MSVMKLGHSIRSSFFRRSFGWPTSAPAWAGMGYPRRRSGLLWLVLAGLIGVGVGLGCLISPWLTLSLVLGAVICIAALSKPVILCYLVVTAIALASGMVRGRLIPYLKPNEAALVLSAGVAFVALAGARRSYVPKSKYARIAFPILFLGTMMIPGVAYTVRGIQLTSNDVFFLLAPLQYLLLFWLFTVLPRTDADRRGIIAWMLICGSVVAAIGLLQAGRIGFVVTFLNQWYPSLHLDQAIAAGRITSLMGGWNVLGVFMMLNLLIAWAFLPSVLGPLGRLGLIVSTILCAACLVASGSFAGIIGLMTGMLVIAALTRLGSQRIAIAVLILIMAAAGVLLFQPLIGPLVQQRLAYQFQGGKIVPQTLAFRFQVWREVFWPVIQQNLFWGTLLSIPASFTWQWAESEYLLLLFRFGIIGLVAWLAWLGVTLGWLARRLRQVSDLSRLITISAFAALVVLVIIALTNEVFEFLGFADYLWILLALVSSKGDYSAAREVWHS